MMEHKHSLSPDLFDTLSDTENDVECLKPIILSSKKEESSAVLSNETVIPEKVEEEKKNKRVIERQQSQALLESFDPLAIEQKLPEKIIFCIDLSDETGDNLFTMADGNFKPMIKVLQNALKVFALSKHAMDPKHEFALVIVHDTVIWVTEFSSDPNQLVKELEVTNETIPCQSFDLSSLFESILEEVSLPEKLTNGSLQNNQYIVRAILFYGRSNMLPTLKPNCHALQTLLDSKHFFLDVLFVHNELINDNKIQEIYDFFCGLDQKDVSYIYEVSSDPIELHNYVAMLLAHPMQRPPQCAREHKILNKAIRTEDTNVF